MRMPGPPDIEQPARPLAEQVPRDLQEPDTDLCVGQRPDRQQVRERPDRPAPGVN
ncbi:hypothetical protein ACFTZI_28735 [Streptomyces decoyicus]|uniref:hypothetical protein n=1 Tax=Streptomyces decoyicus TaxID=249567 RepID=UPI003627051F